MARSCPTGFEEGVTTVGGLVVALAGRVPARGEIVKHPLGFEFEVLDADPRRVKRLRVRGLAGNPANRRLPNMDKATRGGIARQRRRRLAPLQRTALWLASLTRWHRHLAALLLGVLAAASLPPVDMTPVLLISFPGLVWLTDGNTGYRSAFALGWSFGFGFFVAGLYWIAAALFVDIAQFWWLVPFAVARRARRSRDLHRYRASCVSHALCRILRLGGTGRVLALVVCWCGAEWLRGHVLTGFPWNLIGYAWSGAFPGLARAAAIRVARRDLRSQPADGARRVSAGTARRFFRPALVRVTRRGGADRAAGGLGRLASRRMGIRAMCRASICAWCSRRFRKP